MLPLLLFNVISGLVVDKATELAKEHVESMMNKNTSSKSGKLPLNRINNLVRNILTGKTRLDSISQDEEDILFGKDGMFWTRKFSQTHVTNENCDELLKTMSLLEINSQIGGMVVGHTPQNSINSQCSNKIWRIDTGMSEAFGRRHNHLERIEVLEILDNGKKVQII